MQLFINICLRPILRIRWPERIYNQEFLRKIGLAPIIITIKNREWTWIVRTLHREQTGVTR